ncbi:LysM peptidoglycan-binding domain-containing protein [Aureispira anguillae]|uniref:LysM peptidoglycan-binding domain-containing protein n=1 Tax=Aureispira anguillae TaxID=2864201 RepID=A0A915YLV3_9BACT|nr:LysM peptidoglycan-binding domain-containing protein [Aureispira anguillae]BDS15503.1 LysM peptidoglycan-binding domain-containing protein [Aureispira anguillae]
MKKQISWVILQLWAGILISYGQEIQYFSSDSSSYILMDVYAQIGNQIYTLQDSSVGECWAIVAQKDFNNNGYLDLLLGHIHGCGGNCCGNSYSFITFDKNHFVRTQEVGNGDYLHTELWKGKLSILLQTNVKDSVTGHQKWLKERYVLQGDSIVKIETYKASKINTSESDYLLQWNNRNYPANSHFTHVIKKEGQSLWALANKYQTTVSAIKALNQLPNDFIFIGDSLKIPIPDTQAFHLHAIRTAGETLWAISQHYNVPVAVIKRVNGIDGDTIKVGETLKIPKTH